MLQNAYFLAKLGADTAENEQHFSEILPKTSNYPTGSACLSAGLLEAADLRGFALPFDYLISSPQMVSWASKGEVTTIAGNFYEMFCFMSKKKILLRITNTGKTLATFCDF